MHAASHRALLMAGCAAALLVAACNSPAWRKWQRVFLDGVPPEHPTAESVANLPPAGGVGSRVEAATNPAPDQLLTRQVVHPPYAKRECASCHESAFSQKLVTGASDLCQRCHEAVYAPTKFRHAPADSGACLSCHHPHQSAEKALLLLPGRQLCLECHEERDVARTIKHAGIGQTACQVCHDPHGGEQRYFLKAGWQTVINPASPAKP